MHPLALGLLLLTAADPGPAPNAPTPTDQAAAKMTLPEGFHSSLFAGEPDVAKPIAMTLDDRGRLWVAESRCYPHWKTDGKDGDDRILIFEDRKGTGHFDSRKVFSDKAVNLSGIAVGFGGVWLCSTPNLLYIPLKPDGDEPAGPPVVVLDGWDLKAKHNVFNQLVWGPDGWLYGCNGILSNSRVGKLGTPDAERTPINCGVWRYHPVKRKFEAFAHGTTNPWGLDFDERGEAFITNCVIKHLFHVIPGAHYERMFGEDVDPDAYGLMQSCADHIHWAGGAWTGSRGGEGAHGEAGGGHAHAGAMVYLGDNWPDAYRGHIFMCNLHGNRVNQDVPERVGSGYVAHHGKDFLFGNDPWFRGLALMYGPDGGVFVSDWCDTGECHNYQNITETTGRIYKVTYGKPAAVEVDVAKLSDEELVKLQRHKNDWWARHARRVLQERAKDGKLDREKVRPVLLKMLGEEKETPLRLRALWALHVTDGLDEKALTGLLDDADETVRGWAVRLLVEDKKSSVAVTAKLADMAHKDKSASVRLALASAMQRMPADTAYAVAEGLVTHEEDAKDANLPLMIWYGVEPLVPANPDRAAELLTRCRIPLVREYIARRVAAGADVPAGPPPHSLKPLVHILLTTDDAGVQRDVLQGMIEALQGRRLPAPEDWGKAEARLRESASPEVREKALLLSVMFGDAEATAALRKTAADPGTAEAPRRTALQTLVEAKAAALPLLRDLLADRAMRGPALRALAAFSDPETPSLILKHYGEYTDAEKADAVATLASRPAYAAPLLDAMGRGEVPTRDLSAFTARQLLGFNDKNLSEKLTKVWGAIRPPSGDKTKLLAHYLSLTPPDALKKADRAHGRALFARTCAKCHTLFDDGGKIGPDLTGSQRVNPEYVLTKVLDPNAVVAKDFQMTVFTLNDGRVVNGIVKQETPQVVTVQTQNEVVRLVKSDIDSRKQSAQSMMPEGQLTPMSDAEVRDLIAYLAGADQPPLPKATP